MVLSPPVVFFLLGIPEKEPMSRREELEKQLEIAQKRIDEAPADVPKEIMDAYRKELDSISFDLNNLYDDYETRAE